jgi:hypothetical protein
MMMMMTMTMASHLQHALFQRLSMPLRLPMVEKDARAEHRRLILTLGHGETADCPLPVRLLVLTLLSSPQLLCF